MAKDDNFSNNLKYLIENNAIPHTEEGHIGDHVKQAIGELSQQELETLVRLATTANAHLFVHDKKNNVVAMGL
ncbi:hypothetical protein ACFQ14_12860 [Pseudahrensia aquimaris]|uniref:Uncharacterized protein n=1 Tax=Pseudahrensia aquimaris TaxID=744461 RepID=A0ABW3FH97_9HYPH